MLKDLFREEFYSQVKFEKITGRYITNEDLKLFLNELDDQFEVQEIGSSVQERTIRMISFGQGEIKVLAWSQMHGNEGTTTRAVFDLLNAIRLCSGQEVFSGLLKRCRFYFIPILNPDGAKAYTRVNANEVDLNRDMQALSQPESQVLMKQFHLIKPDYCLNLHDQRTIFTAGNKAQPATLSFLTPSMDKERSVDDSRRQSMSLVAGMAQDLSEELSQKIGRYDDAFNLNCAGDTFQNLSIPTVLFEAGHYPGDYAREETRKYVFKALLSCLYQIAVVQPELTGEEAYFDIPENQKLFNDIVIRNAKINGEPKEVAIQFREELSGGEVIFVPEVNKVDVEIVNFGLQEIDAKGGEVSLLDGSEVIENVIVNKIIINGKELELKSR